VRRRGRSGSEEDSTGSSPTVINDIVIGRQELPLDMARGPLAAVNSQFDKRGPGLTPDRPFTVSVVKPSRLP
jgi:hypothetical protein